MPGNRPHHTDKWRSCVEKVMKQGHDESSASAICTTSLQDSGQEIFVAEAARHFHLRGALGAAQTTSWKGKEHLVVPCVALMEGVIHAVNASSPEYVPFEALSKSVDKWNGHPLVVGHPVRDGKQISAYDPKVLDKHCGFIRNAHVNGKRLGFEVLVDPERLTAMKHDQLLSDLRAGKEVEVSVGAFVSTNDKKDSHNGKAYDGQWVDIFPDHFALLPGGRGACSLEMGCGAHRAASCVVTAEDFKALGGPGSGWTAEGGHVPGAQGGAPHEKVTSKLIAKGYQKHEKNSSATQSTYHKEYATQEEAQKAASNFGKSNPQGTGPINYSTAFGRIHEVSVITTGDTYYQHREKLPAANLKKRGAAVFDTPAQAASEEAAELVLYNSMRTLMDSVGEHWDEASGLLDELIAAEEEDPTESASEEEAETELEDAKLTAIRMLCYSMSSALQNIVGSSYPKVTPSDPRYMEVFRAAIGKKISAANMKTIQAAHDSSHSMHGHTVALGASCDLKDLAAKVKTTDCTACKGTGSKDGNPCEACDGSGQVPAVKAAESVRHEGGKWSLYSKVNPRILLGIHATKEEAELQEQAIAKSLARQKVG